MKIRQIDPYGENVIIHSARVKLNLNCTEYCIFDTILSRKKQGKETKFADIENYTAFSPEIIDRSIKNMEEMMLVRTVNNCYQLNKKATEDAFKVNDDKLAEEFDRFWRKKEGDKFINRWPGPRESAIDKFKKARKKYSFDFIISQMNDYFRLLEHETWRKPMQATKFLNIKTGQLEEDFRSQWPEHFKQKESKSKILTTQEKENLFNE